MILKYFVCKCINKFYMYTSILLIYGILNSHLYGFYFAHTFKFSFKNTVQNTVHAVPSELKK